MQNKKTRELINVASKTAELNVTLINWLKSWVDEENERPGVEARRDYSTLSALIANETKRANEIRNEVKSALSITPPSAPTERNAVVSNVDEASKPKAAVKAGRKGQTGKGKQVAVKATPVKTRSTGKGPSEALKAALYESLKRRSTGVGAKELSQELGIKDRREFLKLATWAKDTGVIRVDGSRRGTVYSLVRTTQDKTRVNVNGLMVA